MKLKPVGERALVKPEEREEKTESGIVLPDTAKEKQQTARVVAVGELENGLRERRVSTRSTMAARKYCEIYLFNFWRQGFL